MCIYVDIHIYTLIYIYMCFPFRTITKPALCSKRHNIVRTGPMLIGTDAPLLRCSFAVSPQVKEVTATKSIPLDNMNSPELMMQSPSHR